MTPEDELEQTYGVHTCWEWTKSWLQNERECEDDERCSLEEYLWLMAENSDEDIE